ncbi:hypothetical protein EB354_22680 (plasmid) [Chryseobacterium balustinum]|uniref:Uncharacterized protein n=1 Tax=Chryseobacterium balustinum TaxID=246 RepID=A0ABY1LEH5_9FLAO|nr:hypothetical protein EB354_22680 [Chryseobacterium balustinum]SKB94421.1 hypothetical protein SAMN05421800_11592 [Chryseobacterium balustinum]
MINFEEFSLEISGILTVPEIVNSSGVPRNNLATENKIKKESQKTMDLTEIRLCETNNQFIKNNILY